jgi:plasmid stabilization system protein ParE
VSQARFLEEAEAEFLKEVQYYANVQASGAERFRAAIEEATARALAFPMAGLSYLARTRRVFVKGYPFFLVYRPEAAGVVVLAVVHESRRPGYWMSRAR